MHYYYIKYVFGIFNIKWFWLHQTFDWECICKASLKTENYFYFILSDGIYSIELEKNYFKITVNLPKLYKLCLIPHENEVTYLI